MTQTKQEQLRQKIADGQARLEERSQGLLDKAGEKAIEARDGFTNFAKEHPIATVAGGLAVGALVSGLIYRSRAKRANSVGTGAHQIKEKATTLATLGADYLIGYALKALETAGEAGRAGADRMHELGDAVEHGTRGLRSDAGHLAEDLGDRLSSAGQHAGEQIRGVRDNVSELVTKTIRRH